MFIPITLLQLSFPNDKSFAEALCEKVEKAISEFQDLYSDEIYFVASRFNNRGISQDSWTYRTETGYHITVTDGVADTYVWLVKNIVLNKSCHFRGDEGASFEAYIKTVLNSDFTFKDWLKWKTDDSLIKIPGATGYVPKIIKKLGKTSIDIYKRLRQKKSDDDICRLLGLEYVDYLEYYIKIEECLLESNQIHLIQAPRVSSTNIQKSDDDDSYEFQLAGTEGISPEHSPDVDVIMRIINTMLDDLPAPEKKILFLWGNGYSANQVYDELSTLPFLKEYKEQLRLDDVKDIFPLIEKIITKCMKFISVQYPEQFEEYSIGKKSVKRLVKTYFNFFL